VKVIKQKDSIRFENSKTCIAYEYPTKDKDINIALVKILNDRYPEFGWAVNTVCKELAYITKGEAKLTTKNKVVSIKVGDLVMVMPNEEYYWEGDFEMLVPCAPAWYPKQHKINK
jgi:mannose-6-phosphate isomerase-like protein (cupin superfamily)